MIILLIALTAFSIYTLFRRFVKNPAGSLINPLFLLLCFSLLYFILPTFYIEYTLLVVQRNVESSTILHAKLFSAWYVFCFLIFYLFSIDQKLTLNGQPNNQTVLIAKTLWLLITILLIVIIVLYVPQIYAVRGNRGLAFSMYERLINSRFKLRILLYTHIGIMFILFWKYRSLFWLLPCLLYLIIDYSHGGRTVSFIVLLFAYFVLILKTNRSYLKYAFFAIIALASLGVMQRGASTSLVVNLYMAAAEFTNTHLTTLFLLDDATLYKGSPSTYAVVSLSRVLPGGLVARLLEFDTWYGEGLSRNIGFGFGLAGNLITEALVYGGRYWAVINPLIIGGFLFLLNRTNLYKNLWGFLYILFICITMQIIVRQYFYGFVFYPLQMIFFPLFWSIAETRKKLFKDYSYETKINA